MELFAAGKYSEALKYFEEEAKPQAQLNVAACQFRLEMYRACTKTCTLALELDPSNLGLHRLRGDAYQQMGKQKKARTAWKQGLEAASARSDSIAFLDLYKRLDNVPVCCKVQQTPPTPPEESAQSTPASSIPPLSAHMQRVVHELMQQAYVLRHKKPVNQLRSARLVWQQVLDLPEIKSQTEIRCACLINMGEVALKNRHWNKAVGYMERATQCSRPSTPRRVHALVCNARALIGRARNEHSRADQCYLLATRSLSDARMELQAASGAARDEPVGMEMVGEWWAMEDEETDDDITALQVRVLARSGTQEDLAIELCQQVSKLANNLVVVALHRRRHANNANTAVFHSSILMPIGAYFFFSASAASTDEREAPASPVRVRTLG
jgi:tetratricopeptide (TPR) repeat protein